MSKLGQSMNDHVGVSDTCRCIVQVCAKTYSYVPVCSTFARYPEDTAGNTTDQELAVNQAKDEPNQRPNVDHPTRGRAFSQKGETPHISESPPPPPHTRENSLTQDKHELRPHYATLRIRRLWPLFGLSRPASRLHRLTRHRPTDPRPGRRRRVVDLTAVPLE